MRPYTFFTGYNNSVNSYLVYYLLYDTYSANGYVHYHHHFYTIILETLVEPFSTYRIYGTNYWMFLTEWASPTLDMLAH